ncbi:MAG TPA: type IV pilus secretin family protein [Firmicutes bacterium]|nr:type IV pilus secretin family protein [Bacillota bacterium]
MKRWMILLILLCAGSVLYGTTLKNVSYEKINGGLDVKLEFEGQIKYEIFKLEKPLRLVINLPSTLSSKKVGSIPVDVAGVDEVRFSQFNKDMSRVVVQLKEWYPYFPERKDNTLILHFTIADVQALTETTALNAAMPAGSNELKKIDLAKAESGMSVIFDLTEGYNYTVKESKKEISIDLFGTDNKSGKERIDGDGILVDHIQLTPVNEKDLNVTVALKDEIPYEVDKKRDKLILKLRKADEIRRMKIAEIESQTKNEKVYIRFKNEGWIRYSEEQLPKEEKIRLVFENAYIDQNIRTVPVRKGAVVEVNNRTAGNNVISDILLNDNISYRIYRDTDDIVMEIENLMKEEALASAGPVRRNEGVIKEISVHKGDITLLLTALAQETGYNIVMSKSVQGEVTIDLHNVPWEEALSTILQSNGYTYRIKGNIIRVATPNEFKQEIDAEKKKNELQDMGPVETRIVPISYSSAGDLEKIVKSVLTSSASTMVDGRTNTLIMTDVTPRLEEAMELIKHLDKPTAQVMIESKFIRVSTEVLGSLGINWQLADNTAFFTGDDATLIASGGGVSFEKGSSQNTGQIVTSLLDTFDLSMKLNMLVSENKAEILASPKVTVLNNETASFISGKKIPINMTDESGNTVSQLQEVGIKLDVKPTINASNEVLIEVMPEVSDLVPPADGADLIISTNSAKTKLLVGDGKTAVIGGLVRRDSSDGTSGVPILKDIPIIGLLFKNRTKRNASEEILIFVTPHIILPSEF